MIVIDEMVPTNFVYIFQDLYNQIESIYEKVKSSNEYEYISASAELIANVCDNIVNANKSIIYKLNELKSVYISKDVIEKATNCVDFLSVEFAKMLCECLKKIMQNLVLLNVRKEEILS
jgi:hypothetical protein